MRAKGWFVCLLCRSACPRAIPIRLLEVESGPLIWPYFAAGCLDPLLEGGRKPRPISPRWYLLVLKINLYIFYNITAEHSLQHAFLLRQHTQINHSSSAAKNIERNLYGRGPGAALTSSPCPLSSLWLGNQGRPTYQPVCRRLRACGCVGAWDVGCWGAGAERGAASQHPTAPHHPNATHPTPHTTHTSRPAPCATPHTPLAAPTLAD